MKYEKDKEVVSQEHEEHCYLWVTKFEQRTLYTCNCDKKQVFKAEFKKIRN